MIVGNNLTDLPALSVARASQPEKSDRTPSYQPVEAVLRAFQVLRLVSSLRIASIADLHALTGIAKPTVIRMLETLMHAGYITKDRTFGGYRVTSEVQSLSSGFFGAPIVIEAAHGHAIALTQRIKWPVGIGMLESNFIRLQFTTAGQSPWTLPSARLNMTLDLVGSAMGRAYLAFCPDHEREALLSSIFAAIGNREEREFRRHYIDTLLDAVRRDGYARRERYGPNNNSQTIAAPIMHSGRVLASACVGYFWNSVSTGDVRKRIYKPLREAITRMEEDIEHLYARIALNRPDSRPEPV